MDADWCGVVDVVGVKKFEPGAGVSCEDVCAQGGNVVAEAIAQEDRIGTAVDPGIIGGAAKDVERTAQRGGSESGCFGVVKRHAASWVGCGVVVGEEPPEEFTELDVGGEAGGGLDASELEVNVLLVIEHAGVKRTVSGIEAREADVGDDRIAIGIDGGEARRRVDQFHGAGDDEFAGAGGSLGEEVGMPVASGAIEWGGLGEVDFPFASDTVV